MNIFKTWIPKDGFPNSIKGDKVDLILHDTSDNHIQTLLNMVSRNFEDISKYIYLNHFLSKDSAIEYINERNTLFKKGLFAEYAIFLKDSNYIGSIAIKNMDYKTLSCFYYIDKKFRHLGLMSSSLKLIENKMQEIGFKKIILEINAFNTDSNNLARANGYILDKSKGNPGFNYFFKNLKGSFQLPLSFIKSNFVASK